MEKSKWNLKTNYSIFFYLREHENFQYESQLMRLPVWCKDTGTGPAAQMFKQQIRQWKPSNPDFREAGGSV